MPEMSKSLFSSQPVLVYNQPEEPQPLLKKELKQEEAKLLNIRL
jgi:hypothetical protein